MWQCCKNIVKISFLKNQKQRHNETEAGNWKKFGGDPQKLHTVCFPIAQKFSKVFKLAPHWSISNDTDRGTKTHIHRKALNPTVHTLWLSNPYNPQCFLHNTPIYKATPNQSLLHIYLSLSHSLPSKSQSSNLYSFRFSLAR